MTSVFLLQGVVKNIIQAICFNKCNHFSCLCVGSFEARLWLQQKCVKLSHHRRKLINHHHLSVKQHEAQTFFSDDPDGSNNSWKSGVEVDRGGVGRPLTEERLRAVTGPESRRWTGTGSDSLSPSKVRCRLEVRCCLCLEAWCWQRRRDGGEVLPLPLPGAAPAGA